MDNFLTTYKKDFKWPISATKAALQAETTRVAQIGTLVDPCCTRSSPDTELKPPVAAQCGAPPQGPGSKFNQPDSYLHKLYEKYPYLYNVLKIAPVEDLVKSVLSEEHKSTYQVDFGKEGTVPRDNYQEKVDIIETLPACMEGRKDVTCQKPVEEGKKPEECRCASERDHVPCKCALERPIIKIAWKPAPISKGAKVPRLSKKELEESKKKFIGLIKPPPKIKPFITEYADTIAKTGANIIKNKLLVPTSDKGPDTISIIQPSKKDEAKN